MALALAAAGAVRAEIDFTALRHRMVDRQIVARGISDPSVLDAMRAVARHRFVPAPLQPQAYTDRPLPIGQGQTISQPYIVALMTEVLQLLPSHKVLEIGTGSGYQAAVLAELGVTVFSIEILPQLGRQAAALLQTLGYDRIQVRIGDGYKGWPAHSPFDAVIVTCAPSHVPQPLVDQLAEGGRMVIPVGRGIQALQVLVKKQGRLVLESSVPVRFVPMVGEDGKPY